MFISLIIPDKVYQTSPLAEGVDFLTRRFNKSIQTEDRLRKLEATGREPNKLFTTVILMGVGMGSLVGLLSYLVYPMITPIGIILGLGLGVILMNIALENEHKKYQERMSEGTLPLVRFMPSFLEVEGITPREALVNSIDFVTEPLKSELEDAVSVISRTGKAHEALSVLASKTDDSVTQAICMRLAAAWDTRVTSDIFDDLEDQMRNIEERAVTRATNVKTGLLPLIILLGLVGGIFAFGYPAIQFLGDQMSMFY